jgi:anaerobic glycerol-3-phosphate dehydrogenase
MDLKCRNKRVSEKGSVRPTWFSEKEIVAGSCNVQEKVAEAGMFLIFWGKA